MMQADARHVHPDQATRAGAYNNDNYSIPNKRSTWAIRNSYWADKVNQAVWQNGDLEAFCHKGSNAPEFFHSNTNTCFAHLNHQQIFLDTMPAIHLLQKLSHNLKRAKLILSRFNKAKQYDPINCHIHKEIFQRLNSLLSLDYLRKIFQKDQSLHHYLYFENTSHSIDSFLDGFRWQHSVMRVTRMDYDDIKLINQYSHKYATELNQKYGKFYHKKSLEFIQQKMKFKISYDKLKMLVYKYWVHNEEDFQHIINQLSQEADDEYDDDNYDDDDDDDDDDDYKMINREYDTSACKNKKKGKLCIHLTFVNLDNNIVFILYIVILLLCRYLNLQDLIIHINHLLMILNILNVLVYVD